MSGGQDMGGSVTGWLAALREGDEEAAQQLWNRYYEQLVRVARTHLRGRCVPLADDESIALKAFEAFWIGIQAGRFPNVCDRQNFWHLLLYITAIETRMAARYEGRLKRWGGGNTYQFDLDDLVGPSPTPDMAVELADLLGELLANLDDGQLQEMAILRIEGHSPGEIASRLGCSLSTVERKLRRIRHRWSRLERK